MKLMGQAVAAGETSLIAMAIVVGVAVLREGAEVVLFLYGIAASTNEGWAALLLGGALGIALGAAISLIVYAGLVAIPIHRLFSVTSWLIALVAAGMAGQAAAVLAGADLIPSWGYQLWDSRWLLSQDSIPGRALHALIGYADRPMGVQLVAYVVVLVALIVGARLIAGKSASPERSSGRSATPSRAL
jgi:high-affinity iron transporter